MKQYARFHHAFCSGQQDREMDRKMQNKRRDKSQWNSDQPYNAAFRYHCKACVSARSKNARDHEAAEQIDKHRGAENDQYMEGVSPALLTEFEEPR